MHISVRLNLLNVIHIIHDNLSTFHSGFYMPTCYTPRFNLVCDNEDKQKFLGTLMMSGLLIGSVVGGLSGDYFGRKASLYAATLVMAVSIGTATTFVLFNLPDE